MGHNDTIIFEKIQCFHKNLIYNKLLRIKMEDNFINTGNFYKSHKNYVEDIGEKEE